MNTVFSTKSRSYLKKALPIHIQLDFFERFATLYHAGIPYEAIFRMLSNTTTDLRVEYMMRQAKQLIQRGNTLTSIFTFFHASFDCLCLPLINAGEISGHLDTAFVTIIAHFKRKVSIQKDVNRALFYPVFTLAASLLIVIFLSVFVLPRFTALFSQMKIPLPLITQCFIALNRYLSYWTTYVFATSMFILLYFKKHRLRNHILTLLCCTPIGKRVFQYYQQHLFLFMMAITYRAGISLVKALTLLADKPELGLSITHIPKRQVEEGQRFSDAIKTLPFLTQFTLERLAIAETSGQLADTMTHLSEMCASQFSDTIQKLTRYIEPCCIIAIGSIIGLFMYGLYAPIMRMGNLI